MAERKAEAAPIVSGENLRAAIHQYTKPRPDVIAVVPTREPVFTNSTLFAFNHWMMTFTDFSFLSCSEQQRYCVINCVQLLGKILLASSLLTLSPDVCR